MRFIIFIIVIAQAFCTSLWFAGNAVIGNLGIELGVSPPYIAHLTAAIQFGFIAGTFVFALLSITDRFSPSLVFCTCALLAGLLNLGISMPHISPGAVLNFRFATGFFLAGIYPVGMKIAADHFGSGLGKALGFLVGALVLGTAFPHLLRSFLGHFPWQYVVYGTSLLSFLGGILLLIFIHDGPYRTKAQAFRLSAFLQGFKNKHFRSAAFGYFGHMWELYTFWMFVPIMIAGYNEVYADAHLSIPRLSFTVISSGAVACVAGSFIAQKIGTKKMAAVALSLSLLCCLLSPWCLLVASPFLFVSFLIFWGMVVIADSPLFSTLVAQNAQAEWRGTALTIVNCLGFAITIISIQFITMLSVYINHQYLYTLLGIGPVMGLAALLKK